MSDKTWAQIGAISGFAAATGGILAEIGKTTGSEFLGDAGGILATIGKSGTSVAAAGAFSSASVGDRTAALVSGSPIVQTLIATQSSATPAQASLNQQAQATTTTTERATGGLLDGLAQLIALPFKILSKLLGQS